MNQTSDDTVDTPPHGTITELESTVTVSNYLNQKRPAQIPAIAKVVPLQGGVNHTFRLVFDQAQVPVDHDYLKSGEREATIKSAILKHARPQVASVPQISFDLDRQICEAHALKQIPKLVKDKTGLIKLPSILYHDSQNSMLVMEDVSPPGELLEEVGASQHNQTLLLKEAFKPQSIYHEDLTLAEEVGTALGSFFAELHSLEPPFSEDTPEGFPLNNNGSRIVCALQAFGEFLETIETFGAQLQVQRREEIETVMSSMTAHVMNSKETLIMGDFWAGNVILRILDAASNPEARLKCLHIIDWEFFTCGATFVDLGQFAAEAWLYDHFYPQKGTTFPRVLTKSLFKSYKAEGGVIDLKPIIYYIAGHVGCFLGYAKWTGDPEVRKATALLAVKMIEDVHAENWAGIQEDGFLSSLFE